jgi:hypothetical protein
VQPNPLQPVPLIGIERIDDVDAPARRQVLGSLGFFERDGFGSCRAVPQLDPKVTAIGAKRLGTQHLDISAEEQWLAVADAEWRQ